MLPFDEIKASAPVPAPAAPGGVRQLAGAGGQRARPAPTVASVASESGDRRQGEEGREDGGRRRPANGEVRFPARRCECVGGRGASRAAAAAGGIDEAAPAAGDALLVNGSVSNGIERRAIGNARKGPGSAYRGDFSSDRGQLGAQRAQFLAERPGHAEGPLQSPALRSYLRRAAEHPAPVPQQQRKFLRRLPDDAQSQREQPIHADADRGGAQRRSQRAC